jgi:hypothetical protein
MPIEPDEFKCPHHALGQLGVFNPPSPKAESDVLEDRKVREQRIVLKDETDVAPVGRFPRDVLRPYADGPTRGLDEAGNDPEGRCLSAARWSEKNEKLTVANVQRDIFDSRETPVVLRQGV